MSNRIDYFDVQNCFVCVFFARMNVSSLLFRRSEYLTKKNNKIVSLGYPIFQAGYFINLFIVYNIFVFYPCMSKEVFSCVVFHNHQWFCNETVVLLLYLVNFRNKLKWNHSVISFPLRFTLFPLSLFVHAHVDYLTYNK